MNTRIGNKRDARKAVLKELEWLDSGAYRSVYTDRNRTTVYKVDREFTYNANDAEADAYVTLCDMGGEDIFAPTTKWSVKVPFDKALTGDVEGKWCLDHCTRLMELRMVDAWNYTLNDWSKVERECEVYPYQFTSHDHPAYVTLPVNAQPYYPYGVNDSPFDYATIDDCRHAVYEADSRYDVGDIHDGNWRMDSNGKAWIVDFQFVGEGR